VFLPRVKYIFRKQLPATLDELETKDDKLLPQDYFIQDMKVMQILVELMHVGLEGLHNIMY
jgi:hypothetical protein